MYGAHGTAQFEIRDVEEAQGSSCRSQNDLCSGHCGAGSVNLDEFSKKWDREYPSISSSWRNNWVRIIPLFGYPPEIRKVIYTTNAIESLNMSLRKVTKNRGSFPNDEAAFKLLYLALRNIAKKWTMPIRDWKSALNQFAILFEGRMPLA